MYRPISSAQQYYVYHLHRYKEEIRQLQNSKDENEKKIEDQKYLIKKKGDEAEELQNKLEILATEFNKLQDDVKQKEVSTQQIQQETEKKKEEIEKQITKHPAELKNEELQTKMSNLQSERFI